MRIIKTIIVLLFVCFSGLVIAVPSTVTLATEELENYVNKDGSGYYLELMRAIFQSQGIEVKVKIVPYARSVDMINNKKADVMLGAYKAEGVLGIYANEPLEVDDIDIIVSQKLAASWQGVKSLEGKKVGALTGYSFDDYIDVKMKYKEISNLKSLIKMLNAGRLDAVLSYEEAILIAQKKAGDNASYVLKRSVVGIESYAVFSENPRGKSLREVFDKGMAEMRSNGALRALMIKATGSDAGYIK